MKHNTVEERIILERISVETPPVLTGKYMVEREDGKLGYDTWNPQWLAVNGKPLYYFIQIPQLSQVEGLPTKEEAEKEFEKFLISLGYDIEGDKTADFVDGFIRCYEWFMPFASAIIAKKNEEIKILTEPDERHKAQWETIHELNQQLKDERSEKEELTLKNNKQLEIIGNLAKELTETKSQLESVRKENEQLKKVCDHEWVSSVAYKGARVCTKCNMIQ